MRIRDVRAEILIELREVRNSAYFPASAGFTHNISRINIDRVEFVIDIADDLLQHVFNREKAGHFTELIHNEREMLMLPLEFLQKEIERHRFRDELCLSQVLFQPVVRVEKRGKEILGVKKSLHVAEITIDYREARVPALIRFPQPLVLGLRDVDRLDLASRNHDVRGGEFRNLQHAFNHEERVITQNAVRFCGAQRRDKLLVGIGGRLVKKGRGEPLQEARFSSLL